VKAARTIFLVAGVYGLLVMTPMLFLEKQISVPPIMHPEFYYGFVGVVIAWQFAFLLIARDPARYRAFMVPAMAEKLAYVVTTSVLFAQGRIASMVFLIGMIDAVLMVLFLISFVLVGRERKGPAKP